MTHYETHFVKYSEKSKRNNDFRLSLFINLRGQEQGY